MMEKMFSGVRHPLKRKDLQKTLKRKNLQKRLLKRRNPRSAPELRPLMTQKAPIHTK